MTTSSWVCLTIFSVLAVLMVAGGTWMDGRKYSGSRIANRAGGEPERV